MIRPALASDAPAVGELLEQLGYPQDDPDATAARLRRWADDSAGAVYVAETGSDVLGVIAVHVMSLFERPGCSGRIVALVVSDRARRQGIASRLMAAAEAFAADRGCVRIEVTSSDHRADAHAFYQRRGYVDQAGRSSRFIAELS